jgi:hypothetical protein
MLNKNDMTTNPVDHQDRDAGQARRPTSQVEIHTLGGWMVTLKAVTVEAQ